MPRRGLSLHYFWGTHVLYVTLLSVLALVPNFSTETPVETEDTD